MCGRVSTSKWMDGWIDGWMDVWMHIHIYIYIHIYGCQMATDDAGTTISSAPNMSQCTQKCK